MQLITSTLLLQKYFNDVTELPIKSASLCLGTYLYNILYSWWKKILNACFIFPQNILVMSCCYIKAKLRVLAMDTSEWQCRHPFATWITGNLSLGFPKLLPLESSMALCREWSLITAGGHGLGMWHLFSEVSPEVANCLPWFHFIKQPDRDRLHWGLKQTLLLKGLVSHCLSHLVPVGGYY